VEQVLEHHEPLLKELQQRAAAAHDRLQALLESAGMSAQQQPQPSTSWKTPFSRRTPAAAAVPAGELIRLLRSYAKCRYQALVLRQVTALYVSMRGQLSDQIREVGYCRQRLAELLDQLAEDAAPKSAPGKTAGRRPAAEAVPSGGRCLFPEGCQDLEESVTW